MKKILLAIIASLLISNISFAQTESGEDLIRDATENAVRELCLDGTLSGEECAFLREDESLKEATFDISEVLTLPGESGSTTRFFEDENQSPIVTFFLDLIVFATQIIGSIAVILLIIAGFMFMASQGNEQGLSKAKEVVKYAVIGLTITFLSFVIVIFIQALFNQ